MALLFTSMLQTKWYIKNWLTHSDENTNMLHWASGIPSSIINEPTKMSLLTKNIGKNCKVYQHPSFLKFLNKVPHLLT